jgi:hypothetical protein
MKQQSLFDRSVSESRKADGMALAASHLGTADRPSDLRIARSIARELCRLHGDTDADQVGFVLHDRYGIVTLGPAAGSIFKTGEFEPTGFMRRSTRKSNHARLLYVWRLKGASDV